jgi:hypothetical protein
MRSEITLVKYKCHKIPECPVCQNTGSLQLFINNTGKVTYARVRHHQGKGKYTYCKLDKQDLDLLQSQGLKLPSEPDQGQLGVVKQWDSQPMTTNLAKQAPFTKTSGRVAQHG